MSKFWHGVAHGFIAAFSIAVMASNVLPPPYNLLVPAVQGVVHAVVAIKNHGVPTQ